MTTLLIAFASMGIVAVLLAIVLYFISRKFHVEENLRVKEAQGLLPGINCGACGFAGCHGLAKALVEGAEKGDVTGLFCPPGGNATMEKVGLFLNLSVKGETKKVAVLRCGGTCDAAPAKQSYQGPESCVVAHGLFAGESGCGYGCLGQSDCVRTCTFDAMRMDFETGLPIIDVDKCTACGACVKACPRVLIQLRPYGRSGKRVWVNCQNLEKGALSRKNCAVACIACNKCVKICDGIAQAITMENNLAYIDPLKCITCGKCVLACPTNAILASFPLEMEQTVAVGAAEETN